MTNNIIKFPTKLKWEPTGYRINLYMEEDIYIVLLCLNISDDLDDPKKWVRKDLRTLEPEFVIGKMDESKKPFVESCPQPRSCLCLRFTTRESLCNHTLCDGVFFQPTI